MQLHLVDSRLLGVDLQPNEDGGKAVMNFSSPLTPQIAEKLHRREMLYDEHGSAREFDGSIKIGLVMSSDWDFGVEVGANGDERFSHQFKAEKIRNFRFAHGKGSEDEDSQLRLEFSVHVAILHEVDRAYALFQVANKERFDCLIGSTQGELFEESEEEQEIVTQQTLDGGEEQIPTGKKRRGRPTTEAEVSASVQ